MDCGVVYIDACKAKDIGGKLLLSTKKKKNASCGENHPQNLSCNAREI
jgi:hypothetical protein